MIGEFTTDENGNVIVENLKQGLYKVTEIHAPEGYKLNTETYEVDINQTQFEYGLEIPNKQQMMLPATGGNGIKAVIIAGIVLVMFSNILQNKKIISRKKKGYKLKHRY